ncbi:MAG: DUF262 domain-containing protein [Eubacteriales bacterium]
MRISKKLIVAAAFDPTKMSHQKSIVDMCQDIKDNKISLPLYQRDVSWTLAKSVDLLNYQLFGKAPVSPISINVISNPKDKSVAQVEFINRELIEEVANNQWSVVDGQQRLTTNFKAYVNDEGFRNIVLDLGSAKFTLNNGSLKLNQISVGILLNGDESVLKSFIQKHKRFQEFEVQSILVSVRKKILSYNYTINLANDLSEDEQIEWFEVLNNAGSRVSIIQMRFSKLKLDGIDIYSQYTSKFNEKILEFGYDVFTPEKTTVSYPIAALNPVLEKHLFKAHVKNNFAPIPSDTKENQLCSENIGAECLKDFFVRTLDALDRVLDFINENALDIKDRIDYINYMIGYFVFNLEDEDFMVSEECRNYLVNWYNEIDFNNMPNTDRRNEFTNLLKDNL